MNQSLLLSSSSIFDDYNLIDLIRQTYIDLPIHYGVHIQEFLNNSMKYLKQQLETNILIELISAVLSCLKHYPCKSSPFIEKFLKNSKLNSNYILINSAILSDLDYKKSKIDISNYNFFILEAIKEIIPQIQKRSKLKIFNHEIPIHFKNDLIINLLLTTNLTEELIFNFFPFLFSVNFSLQNSKFDLLIQKVIKLNISKILPQTKESNHELFEFIKNLNFQSISALSREAFSMVECAILFTKSEEKCEVIGLSKETILPFIALILKFVQEFQPDFAFSSSYLSNLISEGIQFIENNNSPLLSISIDYILKNYFKFCLFNIMPINDFFVILTQRLLKGEYLANKIILISSIFELSNNLNCDKNSEKNKQFFNQYGIQIIKYIISNSDGFFNCEEFKDNKLNLELFELNSIIDLIENTPEICQILNFIETLCINVHKLEIKNSIEISKLLTTNLHIKINEQKWNDVLLICKFMNNHGFTQKLEEIKQIEVPDSIKQTFLEFIPNGNENNDQILIQILNTPNPEKSDKLFHLLFDKMIEDEDLLEMYLSLLVYKSYCPFYHVNIFLRLFKIEFNKYKETFLKVIKKIFYFNRKDNILIKKPDFSIYSLPISQNGSSIISKLFNEIKIKKNNYQAFICLKNIANSFPLLFYNRHEEIFNSVFPELNNFSLIFEEKFQNDDHFFKTIKTSYSAFSFLLSAFQLPIMIDHFMRFISVNIIQFSDSQIACFINIFNYLYNDQSLRLIIQASFIKFNVLKLVEEILNKTEFNHIENNKFMKWFKETAFKFIKSTYDIYTALDKKVVIQIDEVKKFENVIGEYFDKIYLAFLIHFFDKKFEINGINIYLSQFISNVERTREFWLIFENEKYRKIETNITEIRDFNRNFDKIKLNEESFVIPKIPVVNKIKAIRYLVKKPIYIYNYFLNQPSFKFVQPLYGEFKKTSEKVVSILNESENKEDPDEADYRKIKTSDYLYPLYSEESLLSYLVKQIADVSNNNECSKLLLGIFQHIAKKSDKILLIFEIISQNLTEIYNNDIIFESPLTLIKINKIIQLLNILSKIDKNQTDFFNTCGNTLLNIILSPKWRNNSPLLLKVAKLFINLKQIPVRNTHLIAFLLLSEELESLPLALQLAKKIQGQQIINIEEFMFYYLDTKLNQEITPEILNDIVTLLPSIAKYKSRTFIELFDKMLKVYLPVKLNDEKFINFISNLFNLISPERGQSTSLTMVIKNSTITKKIRQSSPSFWSFFENHSKLILGLIDNKPLLLDKFHFLLNYPELICFNTRSAYFRMKMKKRIKNDSPITLIIDRHNLLLTSFNSFERMDENDILRKFYIIFENEQGMDSDGLTREWFTLLSKEIFNQDYALFNCSSSNKSYSPNSLSYANHNHLKYFKFAGRFVARALIQGQCIDAHLTTSFLKQILQREPKLDDLQDIDEEIYRSLVYIIENDVNSLEIVFAVDRNDFGKFNTYNLIENGENILVTNDNKDLYVPLRMNYSFKEIIKDQLKAFSDGFNSLILHKDIKIFTPDELDLLICGIPQIDVNDFKDNFEYENPYTAETPIVKMFFNVISNWDNSQLVKLLMFMTGSSRVPLNGFREFCDMCGKPLLIAPGGDSSNLPQSRTCSNMLCIPQYENEADLNEKLLFAINNSDSFEFS